MRNFNWQYQTNVGGCGPISLRQLTDKPDQEILSTCLLHGFNVTDGGIRAENFFTAGQALGIKFGPLKVIKPGRYCRFDSVVATSRYDGGTYVVGVAGHVCIVKAGRIIDVGGTPPDAPVFILRKVLNAPA